jgi:hypothetical protein
VTLQRRADRGDRDTNTKTQQLALDALVAPVGVLPGQPDDQLLDVLVKRWPAGLAVRVGPGAATRRRCQSQQRLGLGEEAGPAGSRETGYGDGLADVPTPTVVGVPAAVVQFLVRRISFVELRNGGKAAYIVSPTIYLLAGGSRTPN